MNAKSSRANFPAMSTKRFVHLIGKPADVRFSGYCMPVPEAGCIIFMGEESHNGYGRFRPSGTKRIGAHRYAWIKERGQIPDGMMVCHKCDTPSCVNVNHLFLGSCKENKADSVRKGRHSHGEKASKAKAADSVINREIAMEIFLHPGTHQSIADKYGIRRQLVTSVKAKRRWGWIHTKAAE